MSTHICHICTEAHNSTLCPKNENNQTIGPEDDDLAQNNNNLNDPKNDT
jgi:hypothetical protein